MGPIRLSVRALSPRALNSRATSWWQKLRTSGSILRLRAEAWQSNAPTIVSHPSSVTKAPRVAQHMSASLLMSTETGTEVHAVADNTPGKNGLQACRSLVRRIDPTPAQANLIPWVRD